ncbi:type I restriction enzyme R protein, partial [Helicobacter pylori]
PEKMIKIIKTTNRLKKFKKAS